MSWWELREAIANFPKDKTSALFRRLNPDDWMWSDVNALLAAESATALSDLRWMEAAGRVEDENMPEHWQPRRFGPPDGDDSDAVDVTEESEISEARQAAAELLG